MFIPTMMIPGFKKLMVLASLGIVSGTASAQATHMMMPEGSKDIDLGIAAGVASRSEGSSKQRLVVLPFAAIRWSNGVFLAPGELGWVLPSEANIQYGPLMAYGIKPERADSNSSAGLQAEWGGFFKYRLTQNIGFKSQLLYGGGDQHQGMRLNLSAWTSFRLSRAQSVSLELGAALADTTYMQSYFGVSAAQAAHGPFPRYDIGGGIKNTFASITWDMQLTPKYEAAVRLGSSYLYEAAAASPLTTSRRSSSAVASVIYHY